MIESERDIMKKLLATLLLCLMVFSIMTGCTNNQTSATPDETDDVVLETEAPVTLYEIKTDYATLKFPEKYKDDVDINIEKEPYTVSFLSDDTLLFTLGFNGGEGDVIGTLVSNSGNMVVRVNLPVLDTKASNYDKLSEIQEQLSVILTSLRKDYQFVDGQVTGEKEEVYQIETSTVPLYYPVKWKDKVTVTSSGNTVRFSSSDKPLFDIVFGEGDGIVVGSYNGTEVKIVDYPLEDEEMKNMQEDVNVILTHLQEEDGFVLAKG